MIPPAPADTSASADPAPAEQWLRKVTLRGRFVALEPLTEAHAGALCAGATPETLQFLARGGPESNTPEDWAAFIVRLNALPGRINWAVLQGGVAVGRISYSTVNPADRWLEIGTMLLPAAQGTVVNPEAKLLLLERAFEVLGANRVQFKADSRNQRSRRALQKLGATEEGTLRQYQVRPDGYARDSVMFSILRAEWPQVREGLEKRLL